MRVVEAFKTANRDVKICWLSAFLRLMSYGLTNQILTLFLSEIHVSEQQMGWFMSLTLIGDVAISYPLTWYADRLGRRRTLVAGAIAMCASGVVFSYSENYYVLLTFAVLGVISPSSDEVGPFKSIEESTLAHLTPHNKRPEVYAVHWMMSTSGSALGSISCGWIVRLLLETGAADTLLDCHKLVFVVYAVLAAAKLVAILLLSDAAETGHSNNTLPETVEEETAVLLKSRRATRGLSPETYAVLVRLLIVFMLDSFGVGFMTSAWMVFYYSTVFKLTSVALGTLFFSAGIIMALSSLPSSILARKFGPVKATLVAQVPSALFFMLIPFAEFYFPLSVLLFSLYNLTVAMDVTPRQILLTSIIKPADLTRVMGIVNMGKTFSRCIGPIFTGLLAEKGLLWSCFTISGSFVLLADTVLLASFSHADAEILSKTNS